MCVQNFMKLSAAVHDRVINSALDFGQL